MASVLDTRWKAAQKAERKAFHSWKLQEPTNHSHFFAQEFSLGSELFNGKSVLEVGCSPGAAIHSLRQARLRVGIDPLASEWGHFYRNGTNHIRGMGEWLPFKDETFDMILNINVLDHVQNPSVVLKEIQRCLKKGGTLVLWLQTFSTLRIIRRVLNLIDAPHPHHFSGKDVSFMLWQVGYSIVYHHIKRAGFNSAISVIKGKLIISGLKSLLAILILGLRESAYICLRSKTA